MSHSFEFVKNPRGLKLFLSVVLAVVPTKCVVPMCGFIPKVEWKRRLVLASPRRTMARPCRHGTGAAANLWGDAGEVRGGRGALLVAHWRTWPSLRGACSRATTEISGRRWRFLMAFPLLSLEPSAE